MKLSFLFSILFLSGLSAQEYGVASYYADTYNGQKTASGELYDRNELTCAHKTHPFGTMLEVTRMDNKRSVRVRVIDRGPFVQGRVVDVSRRAAEMLNLIQDGTARVKVEVVSTTPEATSSSERTSVPSETSLRNEPPQSGREAASVKTEITEKAEPRKEAASKPDRSSSTTAASAPARSQAGVSDNDPKFELVTGKNYKTFDLYKIRLERPEKIGYGVQVASFNNYDNAHKQVADLQGQFFENILLSIESAENGTSLFKIILGPFPSSEAANNYKKNVKKKTGLNGFVVNLSEFGG